MSVRNPGISLGNHKILFMLNSHQDQHLMIGAELCMCEQLVD